MNKRQILICTAAATGAALVPSTDAGAVGPFTQASETVNPVKRMIDQAHDRAVTRHVRLSSTNARLRGTEPERTRREVRDWSTEHLTDENRDLRRENRKLRKRAAAAPAGAATTSAGGGATPGHLQAIAACESGGNPGAVDPSGTYRGKYQFDRQTWASVGGSGDPAAASEAEQDQRAAQLYAQAGASPWPVCGS
jgi:hypothetical protein